MAFGRFVNEGRSCSSTEPDVWRGSQPFDEHQVMIIRNWTAYGPEELHRA